MEVPQKLHAGPTELPTWNFHEARIPNHVEYLHGILHESIHGFSMEFSIKPL